VPAGEEALVALLEPELTLRARVQRPPGGLMRRIVGVQELLCGLQPHGRAVLAEAEGEALVELLGELAGAGAAGGPLGCLFEVLGVIVGVAAPIVLGADKNSPYPFSDKQMGPYLENADTAGKSTAESSPNA
jgi:hypothetical protein